MQTVEGTETPIKEAIINEYKLKLQEVNKNINYVNILWLWFQANKEIDELKNKLEEAEKQEKNTQELKLGGNNNATVGKKINTVRPLRLEQNCPILEIQSKQTAIKLVADNPVTSSPSSKTNSDDVKQLEIQCRGLEEQLESIKYQIVQIVSQNKCVNKENALLRNYQIAFDTISEQNVIVMQNMKSNCVDKMLDVPGDMRNIDRTSPDGQEIETAASICHKSSEQYESEIKKLNDTIKNLEANVPAKLGTEQERELKEKNIQLEESLELIREEFESMEDYWQKKLEEERSFYEEQLKISEGQFKELEARLKDYDDVIILQSGDGKQEKYHKDEEDKLSTIEETFSLECQVH